MTDDTPSVDRATEYCTYCPKLCRCSCPAADAENRETVTPWGMMRLYEFVKDGSVAPDRQTAEVFWHCMGCRRCQEWCLHDNDVPEAMWRARRQMANRGVVPEALEGFAASFRENGAPHGDVPVLADATAETTTVDDVFDRRADVIYVPDCETRCRRPDDVLATGRLLEKLLGEKVRLHEQSGDSYQCCGFPLGAAGDRRGWVDQWKHLQSGWETATRVICECPAMVAQVRPKTSFGPGTEAGIPAKEIRPDVPDKLVHVIEVLAERVPEEPPDEPLSGDDWMLHDSCFTTRQLDLAEETRTVLSHLCDPAPDDFHVAGKEAPCCGGPSHYHVVAPEASERLAADRLEQMRKEGGESVVCGAATCRKAFARANEQQSEQHRAADLLELAALAYGISIGTDERISR